MTENKKSPRKCILRHRRAGNAGGKRVEGTKHVPKRRATKDTIPKRRGVAKHTPDRNIKKIPKKTKMALYWAASCGGCDIAVLEIHEKLLDLLKVINIVFWPCVMDFKYTDVEAMPDGSIDACLFNGGIRTSEHEQVARLLRRKSKLLVSYGSCAAFGGIPGLANLYGVEEIRKRIYTTNESTDNLLDIQPSTTTQVGDGKRLVLPELNPKLLPLDQVVEVDYLVPGCPPTEKQTLRVFEAIMTGMLPPAGSVIGAGQKVVCDECPRVRGEGKLFEFQRPHQLIANSAQCLLEQGIICAGPATRSGCEARCLSVNMACRGCYGPAGEVIDQGAKMIGMLASVVGSEKEEDIRRLAEQVEDPVGTFYRFTLPASLLGHARR